MIFIIRKYFFFQTIFLGKIINVNNSKKFGPYNYANSIFQIVIFIMRLLPLPRN